MIPFAIVGVLLLIAIVGLGVMSQYLNGEDAIGATYGALMSLIALGGWLIGGAAVWLIKRLRSRT